MALRKVRISFTPTHALYWQIAMLAGVAAAVGFAILLWLGGTDETNQAMANGRRLIIRISDGAIEGKTDAPDAPPETADINADAPATATTSAVATASATSKVAAAPDPTSITASETAQQSAAAALLEEGNVKVATVPLAPIKDALTEKLSIGNLPMIAADGTRPWRYYAKPYALKGSNPMIAIIVKGLGQSREVTEAAIKLPEPFSLSFSPYAKDVTTWAVAARAVGHEILTDLPLEPTNYPAIDPGPYALMLGKSIEDNARNLQWLLGRMQGYIGFTLPVNEAFSTKDDTYRHTLELIASRGLMLMIPLEPVRKETKKILTETRIAYLMGDSVIDEELSEAGVAGHLSTLEKLATKRGFAVGYAHATPFSVAQLNAWAKTLDERGYTLVPISYITALKFKK